MQEVLVLPRRLVSGLDGFIPWTTAGTMVRNYENCSKWMAREKAELQEQWIQPIPCAIFRDSTGKYCVFRYPSRDGKPQPFSLVVGGHIDQRREDQSLLTLILETLQREILEEIGIELSSGLVPIGITVDSSSLSASRHTGIIYQAQVDQKIKPRASEEFSVRSIYSGRFLSTEGLAEIRGRLDPWSSIIFFGILGAEV